MYKKIINILLNEKDPESRLMDIYALFEKTYNKPLVYYTDGTQSHTLREKSIVWKKCHAADPFIKELVHMDIQLNHIFYAESWNSDNYKCIFVPMDDEIKNQQRLMELLITILNIWGENVPINYTINTEWYKCDIIKNSITEMYPDDSEMKEKVRRKLIKEEGKNYAFIILDEGIDKCTEELFSKSNLPSGHTKPYFLDVIAMPV